MFSAQLQELKGFLQKNYEERAKIYGFLDPVSSSGAATTSADPNQKSGRPTLPLHNIHFTLLERELLSAEEEKKAVQSGKKDTHPERLRHRASLGHEQNSEDKPIVVSELFSSFDDDEKIDAKEHKTNPRSIAAPSDVHRVLITGKAGSGKTTLSKYIAREWVEKKLWPDRYQHVFWITLKDLHDHDATELALWAASDYPLAALIHGVCLNKEDRQKIGIEVIQDLLENQPQQTLILADGFDEVARLLSDKPEDHPGRKLLKKILGTSCDLLVTSREYSLPPRDEKPFDRRFINMGFTDEQVDSYISSFFNRPPKFNPEFAKEVQKLLKNNPQLWSHAHNPLILVLACEFYCTEKEALEKVSLLGLYDAMLKTFIRRYLDSEYGTLLKDKVSWEKTGKLSLENLISYCSVAIEYLQEFSYAEIQPHPEVEKKEQEEVDKGRRDKIIDDTINKFSGDYGATKDQLNQTIKLGLLRELPGQKDIEKFADKKHEFIHLTFQEYFAARKLADDLVHNGSDAYQWLRENKYQPRYREVLGFLCGIMTKDTSKAISKAAKSFWSVLLEEQTDAGEYAHLQLMMYSLEAARLQHVPNSDVYLASIQQAIIHLSPQLFDGENWLVTAIRYCPNVMRESCKTFFDYAMQKLQNKNVNEDIIKQVYYLLNLVKIQAGQLSPESSRQLFNLLGLVDVLLIQARSGASSSMLFSRVMEFQKKREEERSSWLGALRAGNYDYLYGEMIPAGAFSKVKHYAFFVKLLAELKSPHNIDDKYTLLHLLPLYAARLREFTEQERSEILVKLLVLIKDKDADVKKAVCQTLLSIIQAKQFIARERDSKEYDAIMAALQVVKSEANGHVKRLARLALSALTQPEQSSPEKPTQVDDQKSDSTEPLYLPRLRFFSKEDAQKIEAGQQDASYRSRIYEKLQRQVADVGLGTEEERDQLLYRALFLLKDDPDAFKGSIRDVLLPCIGHIEQFSVRIRGMVLTTLFALMSKSDVLDSKQDVYGALQSCIARAGLFPMDKYRRIPGKLLRWVVDVEPNVEMRNTIWWTLESYVSRAGQLPIEARDELISKILLPIVKDKVLYKQESAFAVVERYVAQAEQSPTEENIKLLDSLLNENDENLRQLAVTLLNKISWSVETMIGYDFQLLSAKPKEDTEKKEGKDEDKKEGNIIKTGISLYLDECGVFLMAAPKQPGNYQQSDKAHLYLYKDAAGLFYRLNGVDGNIYLAEPQQPFPDVLKQLENSSFNQPDINPVKCNDRAVCASALAITSKRGHTYPDGKVICYVREKAKNHTVTGEIDQSEFENFKDVLILLQGKKPEAAKISPEIRKNLLQAIAKKGGIPPVLSSDKSYALLEKALQEKEFLNATPLDQLFHFYFSDTAAGVLNTFLPRRELWLKFIVARTLREGSAVRMVNNNQLMLDGASGSKPPILFSVPESSPLIVDLCKAFAAEAKKSGLAMPVKLEQTQLGAEEKQEKKALPATLSGAMQDEGKRETDARVNVTNMRVDDLDERVKKHEREFKAVHATLAECKTMVDQHEKQLNDFNNSIKTLQSNIKQVRNTVEASRNQMGNTQTKLNELQGQLRELQHQAQQTNQHVDGLEEKQKEYDQKEQELLGYYETLSEGLQQFVTISQEQEAKRQAEYKAIQDSKAELVRKMEKINEEINGIQSHDVTELSTVKAYREKLLEDYKKEEQRIKEREALLENAALANFYQAMYVKLNGFFLVCSIASTGLIDLTFSASRTAKGIQKAIKIAGDIVPIPGAVVAASLINDLIDWHRQTTGEAKANQAVMAAPVSLVERDAAIEQAVKEMVHRYEDQIPKLTDKGVVDATSYAIKRIFQGAGEHTPVAGDAEMKISFPTRLVNYLHRVESGGDVTLEVKDSVKPQPWKADGFFRCSGIRSEERLFSTQRTIRSGLSFRPVCDSERYGFRKIDDDKQADHEATIQGFEIKRRHAAANTASLESNIGQGPAFFDRGAVSKRVDPEQHLNMEMDRISTVSTASISRAQAVRSPARQRVV